MRVCECCGQEIRETRRTDKQNAAIHTYFRRLANDLNEAGYDMKKVLEQKVDTSWNEDNVKTMLWYPIQEALVGHKKTSRLTTEEIDSVYSHLARHLASKFSITTRLVKEIPGESW